MLIGLSLLFIACNGLTKKAGSILGQNNESDSPRVEIKKKWITYDETKDDMEGIKVHLDLIAHYLDNKSLTIMVYVEQPQGSPLKDEFHVFSKDDKLCIPYDIITFEDHDPWDDCSIFIPDEAFDLGNYEDTFYLKIKFYNKTDGYLLDNGEEYLTVDLITDDEFNPPADVVIDNPERDEDENYVESYEDEPVGDKYYNFDTGPYGNMEMWVHPDGSSTIKTKMLCHSCRGKLKCNICGGTGNAYALIGGYMPCPTCQASPGTCATCKGEGYIVSTKNWTPAQAQAYLDAHREIKNQYERQSKKYSSERERQYIETIEYEPNYTGKPNDQWCEKCQKFAPAHYHAKKRIPN